MRFEFTPTPDDYKKVIRIYHLSDMRLWIIMGLIGIPQLCCSLYIIINNGFSAGVYPFILLLLFPAFILYLLVWVPMSFAQRAKKDERLRAKTTWIVSEEQIIVKNDHSDSKTTWELIRKSDRVSGVLPVFLPGEKEPVPNAPQAGI